eukprot:3458304-Prorocentrum_lima.AAC.1
MLEWIASINSDMHNFKRLESLQEATPEERPSYKGRVLPFKMAFAKKFLAPQQIKNSKTTKSWKAKS